MTFTIPEHNGVSHDVQSRLTSIVVRKRSHRLQTHTNKLLSAVRPILFAVVCFAISHICGLSVAASRAIRQFEVASIKPSRPGAVGSLIQLRSPQGGTTTARNVPLRDLILVAYHIDEFQLSGGPGWLNTERYDFDAKYQGSATVNDIRA